MGCCESRKSIDCKFEESLFSPFETKIGLSKYKVSDTYLLFGKYSKNSHMSYFQVIRIFEELCLPFKDFFDFYDQFDRNRSRIITEKKFSYLQLQSLNILYCKGELKSKFQYLFNLYDVQSIRVLSRVKIEEMLENIFKVALDYIPTYFIIKSPDNEDLQRYKKTIKIGNDALLERLSRKILRKKHLIGLEEFMTNVSKSFGRNFLNPQYLRSKAFYLGVNGKEVKIKAKRKPRNETTEQFLEDYSDVSSEFITTIESRKLRHKKSISNFCPMINYYFSEDGFDDDRSKTKPELPKSSESTPTGTNFYGRTSFSKNFTVVSHVRNKELTEIKSEEEEILSPSFPFSFRTSQFEGRYLNAVDDNRERGKLEKVNRASVKVNFDTKID